MGENRRHLAINRQTKVYDSVFDMLPDELDTTPPVRLRRLAPEAEFGLYAKLEWMNPFGSVKDRAAWYMLRDLEERGEGGGGRGPGGPALGRNGINLCA